MDDTSTPQTDQIEEAEIVEEVQSEQVDGVEGDALQMIDLEKTIKNFYSGIKMKREELKKLRDMINDTLETDKTYAIQQEKINEAKREQQGTKDQLMSLSSVVEAKVEMKNLGEEIKELDGYLSKNLLQYWELTKKDSITMNDGETYQIKQSAKLVKQGVIHVTQENHFGDINMETKEVGVPRYN
jgi:chromatin segregation and condensation protein Rec8/ScpA/Scc1 (kleisin family)